MSKEKRSPLKASPLRNPGQSLDEQIRGLVLDYATGPLFFAVLIVFATVLEWLKYYRSLPPNPWLYSALAGLAVGYAIWRFFCVESELRQRRLGRDGEKAVGQFLEALRERGYRIFHDLVGNGFNIDHVVIGPAGIFTVETKTHSKPAARGARVVFDGDTIFVDGFPPDRDPVVQAKAQASWVRGILAESTGMRFDVKPVVLYPGWFVEYTGPKQQDTWVLNPKGLPAFLQHEAARLTPEQIQLASFHLSRFVRAN